MATLHTGENPFENKPGLSALVTDLVEDGRFRPTIDGEAAAASARIYVITVPTLIDEAAAASARIYVITVPTLIDEAAAASARIYVITVPTLVDEAGAPDLSYLRAATRTVALLGVTYRPDVPETRESPAIDIAERLAEPGATVLATDPLVDDSPEMPGEFISLEALESREIDAAILVTAHEAYEAINSDAFAAERNAASNGVDGDAVPATDGNRRGSAERPSDEQPGIVVIDCHQALDLSGTPHRQYTIGKWIE